MFEDGKPRSSGRRTVTKPHTDTVEQHNDELLMQFCQAIGLSPSEVARVVSAVDEPAEMSAASRSSLRGGMRTRWK
jgi:hypothetical protein